jgi:MoaA/NifB/PqqE/SkfB family radical SAM enzyme
MSDTTTIETPPAAKPPAPPAPKDFFRPVVRPKKGTLKLIGEVLKHGGPGYLQFAITNICNADCDFCGFARSKFDPKARHSVSLDEAKLAIDIALKNHIGYLLFVGGEPMVHRDLRAMVH